MPSTALSIDTLATVGRALIESAPGQGRAYPKVPERTASPQRVQRLRTFHCIPRRRHLGANPYGDSARACRIAVDHIRGVLGKTPKCTVLSSSRKAIHVEQGVEEKCGALLGKKRYTAFDSVHRGSRKATGSHRHGPRKSPSVQWLVRAGREDCVDGGSNVLWSNKHSALCTIRVVEARVECPRLFHDRIGRPSSSHKSRRRRDRLSATPLRKDHVRRTTRAIANSRWREVIASHLGKRWE